MLELERLLAALTVAPSDATVALNAEVPRWRSATSTFRLSKGYSTIEGKVKEGLFTKTMVITVEGRADDLRDLVASVGGLNALNRLKAQQMTQE